VQIETAQAKPRAAASSYFCPTSKMGGCLSATKRPGGDHVGVRGRSRRQPKSHAGRRMTPGGAPTGLSSSRFSETDDFHSCRDDFSVADGAAGSHWHQACWEASPPLRRFRGRLPGRVAAMGFRKGSETAWRCPGFKTVWSVIPRCAREIALYTYIYRRLILISLYSRLRKCRLYT